MQRIFTDSYVDSAPDTTTVTVKPTGTTLIQDLHSLPHDQLDQSSSKNKNPQKMLTKNLNAMIKQSKQANIPLRSASCKKPHSPRPMAVRRPQTGSNDMITNCVNQRRIPVDSAYR
jgi:hypothetical protein